SAAVVAMVKLRSTPALLPHWLEPPLELQAMEMPFVNLNVLPLFAGAWCKAVLTESVALPLLGGPPTTENWVSVRFQPFDDVFTILTGPTGLPKPKFKLLPPLAWPLPLAPVFTKAQPDARLTVMVVRPPLCVTVIVLPATVPQPPPGGDPDVVVQ